MRSGHLYALGLGLKGSFNDPLVEYVTTRCCGSSTFIWGSGLAMFSASIGREGLEITHSYYRAGLPLLLLLLLLLAYAEDQPGSPFIVHERKARFKPHSLAET